MDRSALVRLYPHAFHMAAAGSWPSIQRHGLLSTSALVERWGAQPDASLGSVRRSSVTIAHPTFGLAVVRDQKPLHLESLERALEGRMSVEEWLAELNGRVFFFGQRESLDGLLNSPSYRNDHHDVLTLDMATLVARHGDRIELTGMNTGFAQPHNHKARGRETFVPLDGYPHPQRAVARVGSSARELVEICIPHSVPDVVDHVLRVERMHRSQVVETHYVRQLGDVSSG